MRIVFHSISGDFRDIICSRYAIVILETWDGTGFLCWLDDFGEKLGTLERIFKKD